MVLAVIMLITAMTTATTAFAVEGDSISVSSQPSSGVSGNLSWSITDGVLNITGKGDMLNYTSSTVPWDLYSYPVYTINIADTVTSIGEYAFCYFDDVTQINLGKGIKKIGKKAFYSCDNITKIAIPSTVTYIGEDAFSYCDKLTSISTYAPITTGDYAFSYCETLQTVNIPKAKSIAQRTFAGCVNLKTANFGNATLDKYVFGYSNSSVTSVTAGSLKEDALDDCIGLTKLNLKNARYIGNYAVSDCKNLTSVSSNAKTIGNYAFKNCISLKSVNFPYATVIGEYAFRENKNLQTVKLGRIQTIKKYAFAECSALRTVSGTSYLKKIEDSAFGMDVNLQSFGSARRIQYIGDSAFYNCKKLKGSFNFSYVTYVGDSAFANCPNLTSTLNFTRVNKIGSSAFVNCRNVKANTLGVKLIELGSKAFVGCSKISQLYIPSCCKKFGYDIFPKKISSISISSYGFMTYNYYTNGPKIAVCGVKNSEAQRYAKLYKSSFRYAVTSIRTSRNSYSVSRGKTAKIGIYVNPSYASNRSVTLTTSNKNIATVNSKGYIKGIRKGKCTITIKSRDGSLKSKSVTVTVK